MSFLKHVRYGWNSIILKFVKLCRFSFYEVVRNLMGSVTLTAGEDRSWDQTIPEKPKL